MQQMIRIYYSLRGTFFFLKSNGDFIVARGINLNPYSHTSKIIVERQTWQTQMKVRAMEEGKTNTGAANGTRTESENKS